MSNLTITVARGDGVGPEITEAVLQILEAAGAPLDFEYVEIGENVYNSGISSGISKDAWHKIKKNKILLKAPITTPQGKGYKSLNVTFRKSLGLFANVRPVVSYHPFVRSLHPKMDIVIVRENEEDLYAGIEYRSTQSSLLSLKLISIQGCQKIIRYAFEYARSAGRKKVTCMSKDNIMKMTDGTFHLLFKSIAQEYPEIEADHYIIDIGSARIAAKPEIFDVIVTLNLYGDIISDIASEVSGSVGMAGSANIGTNYAMFEAVHGSAPDIAGRNVANPSGLLNASILMLEYLGQVDVGTKIRNAWLNVIESGIHTADIYDSETSAEKVSTSEFAAAVVRCLGKEPMQLSAAVSSNSAKVNIVTQMPPNETQELIGIDVYIQDTDLGVNKMADIAKAASSVLSLQTISQRGLIVWPEAEVEDAGSYMMRLRFFASDNVQLTELDLIELQRYLLESKIRIAMTHTLYEYSGAPGFTKSQGE